MIWTLLPGAVFLADGCLKKKAEEELKENEQIPVCKGHIVKAGLPRHVRAGAQRLKLRLSAKLPAPCSPAHLGGST